MKTINDIFKKSSEIKMYYDNSSSDIKKMIQNIYNASFRFGLNDTQIIYMMQEALRPFKSDLLSGLLK